MFLTSSYYMVVLAASQLIAYLEINKLLPVCQSGFRKGHSTETLLLRLLSDIYGAVDRSWLTLLALFDVSTAFDTVDHEILLKRLQLSFSLSGNFLTWLASFLDGRSLCVVHGPLGPNGSPPLMAFPRDRCWPLFSISSTHRNLVLSLLTVLCWVSCMLMMSRPTCTVWHLMPWLPFRQ